MDFRTLGRRTLVVAVLIALAGFMAVPAPSAAGLSICPTGAPGPGDPSPGPPVPFIGGTVTDDESAPIAGAAVLLMRCVAGVPLLSGTAVTPSDGTFSFANLASGASYVVYVPLDGVLGGLAPTTSTYNPSWVIDGAQGDDHVDMAFE